VIVRLSDPSLIIRLRERAARERRYPAAIVVEALRAHLRRLDDAESAYAEPLRDEP